MPAVGWYKARLFAAHGREILMTPATILYTRRSLAFALLCAAELMVVLDVAIEHVVLPSTQDSLGFSQEDLQWAVSSYVLTFGGGLDARG